MTTFTGPWTSNDRLRAILTLTYSPTTVGTGTSQVTVSWTLTGQTRFASNESGSGITDYELGNDIVVSGSMGGWNEGAMGTWLIASGTKVFNTSYTAAVKVDVGATFTSGGAYPGTTAGVSGSITIPKRPVSAPAAPTGCDWTRVSDTQHTVTWTRTSPTNVAAPYTSQQVERQTNDGAWARIATVTGSVSSYSDRSTVANRKYRYRVRAVNSAGASGYSTSGAFATTPPAPPAPVAKKTAGGSIALTWADNSLYNTGVQVWHAANGVWDGAALATLGQVTSYTHVAPSTSVTHTYRLKQTTTDPALTSAYSPTSNVVQLLAAPLAPTKLSPLSVARDATGPITFSWQHNAVDTTDQTKFEVRYRLVGATLWDTSGTITSGTESWTTTLTDPPYVNGLALEWQVRTWGDFATASPYSATATVPLSSAPTVLINTPDGVTPYPGSVFTVTWGYNDNEANPQAAWRATLYDQFGEVIETRTGAGSAGEATFTTAVSDGASYSVGVAAQDSTAVWSTEEVVPFTVEFALPPQPVLTVQWLPDSGAVAVQVNNPDTVLPEVDAVSVQVWRSVDGQEWALIADALGLNQSATDFIPGLGVTNYYKARAFSALPSMSESDVIEVVTEGQPAVWINAGAGFSQSVRLASNPQVSIESGRAKTLRQFAGRTRPVEVAGQQRTRTISVSASLYAPTSDGYGLSSTWEDVEELAEIAAPACYRDPEGRRWFVSTGTPSVSGLGQVKRDVSWQFTQVDYHEPTEADQ